MASSTSSLPTPSSSTTLQTLLPLSDVDVYETLKNPKSKISPEFIERSMLTFIEMLKESEHGIKLYSFKVFQHFKITGTDLLELFLNTLKVQKVLDEDPALLRRMSEVCIRVQTPDVARKLPEVSSFFEIVATLFSELIECIPIDFTDSSDETTLYNFLIPNFFSSRIDAFQKDYQTLPFAKFKNTKELIEKATLSIASLITTPLGRSKETLSGGVVRILEIAIQSIKDFAKTQSSQSSNSQLPHLSDEFLSLPKELNTLLWKDRFTEVVAKLMKATNLIKKFLQNPDFQKFCFQKKKVECEDHLKPFVGTKYEERLKTLFANAKTVSDLNRLSYITVLIDRIEDYKKEISFSDVKKGNYNADFLKILDGKIEKLFDPNTNPYEVSEQLYDLIKPTRELLKKLAIFAAAAKGLEIPKTSKELKKEAEENEDLRKGTFAPVTIIKGIAKISESYIIRGLGRIDEAQTLGLDHVLLYIKGAPYIVSFATVLTCLEANQWVQTTFNNSQELQKVFKSGQESAIKKFVEKLNEVPMFSQFIEALRPFLLQIVTHPKYEQLYVEDHEFSFRKNLDSPTSLPNRLKLLMDSMKIFHQQHNGDKKWEKHKLILVEYHWNSFNLHKKPFMQALIVLAKTLIADFEKLGVKIEKSDFDQLMTAINDEHSPKILDQFKKFAALLEQAKKDKGDIYNQSITTYKEVKPSLNKIRELKPAVASVLLQELGSSLFDVKDKTHEISLPDRAKLIYTALKYKKSQTIFDTQDIDQIVKDLLKPNVSKETFDKHTTYLREKTKAHRRASSINLKSVLLKSDE